MMQHDLDELARAAYRAWAANKNQPAWECLPDFRKEPWRKVARAVWARLTPKHASLR